MSGRGPAGRAGARERRGLEGGALLRGFIDFDPF